MDIHQYMNRIRYSGPLDVSEETLRQLHKAHLLSIPFENLDNHVGRRIILEEEKMIRKLVEERRGGICYELNGAFCALLRELGFEVSMLSAGVARDSGGFDPPFDHMTLMVNLEQRWLADVGFGDCFREPLLLDARNEQVQGDDAYRLSEDDGHLILFRREDGDWKPQYRFTLEPYPYSAFSEMCVYHQTSPESIFTQRRACSLATPEGRITVTDKRVIITERGEKRESELASREEWRAALLEHFDIDLERIAIH
jgi:N-hydroxyarylamine O-acetyltransferase